jgi:hypothetical protein
LELRLGALQLCANPLAQPAEFPEIIREALDAAGRWSALGEHGDRDRVLVHIEAEV